MITGGDLRQSRLDVGYKTFTISPWNSNPAMFSIEEFGFDGAFRLAAIKARQTHKLSFDEQTINIELDTAKKTIQKSHPNLYLH